MSGRVNPLDCDHCGRMCGPSEDDPCIENLPGVMNACCGHGKPELAYIQYSRTNLIRGRPAFERLQEMRDIPKPRPTTLTLAQVLAGAARAAKRVANWPKWKRDL